MADSNSWDTGGSSPSTDAAEDTQDPQVAPQRAPLSDPLNEAASLRSQMAGYASGLAAQSMDPAIQKQYQQLALQNAQAATNHLAGQTSPLRKIGQVLTGIAGGAGSGFGMQGVQQMMMQAQNKKRAEDQNTIMQLKAAHQFAQQGMDPKVISQIFNGFKGGAKNAVDEANARTRQQQMGLTDQRRQERNQISQQLADIAGQRADTGDLNALSNQQYRQTMGAAATQNAGSRATQTANQGEHLIRADRTAANNSNINQQRANTFDTQIVNQGAHMQNQDTQSANKNDFSAKVRHYQMGLGALAKVSDVYDKLRLKGQLSPEDEASALEAHNAYKTLANEAYNELQPPAPVQPVQQPQGMSAGPAKSLNEAQAKPQAAAQVPHQAVQSLAQAARQIYHQHPGLSVAQAVAQARQMGAR